jgi:hypothetical protein
LPASDVRTEAGSASHAGDIFKTPPLDPFGLHNAARLTPAPLLSNQVHVQEHQLGLWAPNSAVPSILRGAQADNLRDFEFDNIRSYTDTDGDGMINNAAYFALDRASPTITGGLASPADILMVLGADPSAGFDLAAPGGGFAFSVLATAADLGLRPDDGIDGLILSRPADLPHLMPGDQALFSLDPASPSVDFLSVFPGAIYYTDFLRPFQPLVPWNLGGSLYALPSQIGLDLRDNIDGLDIFAVPEPGTAPALGIAATLLGLRRRRRGGQCTTRRDG